MLSHAAAVFSTSNRASCSLATSSSILIEQRSHVASPCPSCTCEPGSTTAGAVPIDPIGYVVSYKHTCRYTFQFYFLNPV